MVMYSDSLMDIINLVINVVLPMINYFDEDNLWLILLLGIAVTMLFVLLK